jgi:hypothetical protein
MTRQDAYQKLTSLVKTPNLIKHHLACEAVMQDLCLRITPGADRKTLEKWGIVGLLHDADYELTKNNPSEHTKVLEEKIGKELDPDVLYAIKAHNYKETGAVPKSNMDKAMYACDELTGLIIAAALIHPTKKLSSLNTEFILKRFNENSFAKGADREQIKTCEKNLNIPLNEFIQIGLLAMQKIAPKLGL